MPLRPCQTSPAGDRVRNEAGRTPNSATLPQSTCCRLPEAEIAQILKDRGRGEKRSFWQTPAGLNVLYSLQAG